MPWRTLLETGAFLISRGVSVEIISIAKEKKITDYDFNNVHIKAMPDNPGAVVSYVNENKFDVFLLQAKWRDGLRNLRLLQEIRCRKMAYFDGGVYHLRNAMALLSTAGFRIARPYLLEALTPKSLIINKLKKYGFTDLVGLTDYTAKNIKKAGFKQVATIYPGNDFQVAEPLGGYEKIREKYFLFAGSPHLSRGSIQLLHAFDIFANNVPDAKIIFLMRRDAGSDFAAFESEFATVRNKSKINVVRENLAPGTLIKYFKEARSVILPFLTIPSEIPLTFFEVLSTGTPVITFPNGGTTRYLSPALAVSKNLNAVSLARTMQDVWTNDIYRNQLSRNATAIMERHPTWNESGEEWLKLISGR